ncbi:MAG TPA: fertility inhibition FinO-like protein [Acidobacteriota bacterium]|nr:fertility inhibition FinO-like protein [Acidobacteriota bacterium]
MSNPVPGKMELIVKFSTLPEAQLTPNGWAQFDVEADGKRITMQIKPKMWKKLEEAQASFVHGWTAAVTGRLGPTTETGFILLEPNVQVFERKPKPVQV